MSITTRSTKAEILQAYEQQQRILTAGATWEQVWAKVATTGKVATSEAVALVKDCYRLGQWTRRCYNQVIAELSAPLFKA